MKIVKFTYADLSTLPPNEEINAPPPSAEFIASVWTNGVHTPIKVIDHAIAYEIKDGRRRILAARECYKRAMDAGMEELAENLFGTIPMLVYEKGTDGIAEHVLQVSSNVHRSENPISDLQAVRALLNELHDYQAVAEAIDQPVSYVKRLDQTFGSLDDEFVAALVDGKIAKGTAERLAKKSAGIRENAKAVLRDEGKLLGRHLKELTRARGRAAVDAINLPSMDVPEVTRKYAALDMEGQLHGPFDTINEAAKHGAPYNLNPVR
jgi:ParB-like chromosome segregation protein Spo0J